MAEQVPQLRSTPSVQAFFGDKWRAGDQPAESKESEEETPDASTDAQADDSQEAATVSDDSTNQDDEQKVDKEPKEKDEQKDWKSLYEAKEKGERKLQSQLQRQEVRFQKAFTKLEAQLEQFTNQQAEDETFKGRSDEDLWTVADQKKAAARKPGKPDKGGDAGARERETDLLQEMVMEEGAEDLIKFVQTSGLNKDPAYTQLNMPAKIMRSAHLKYGKDIEAAYKKGLAEGQQKAAKRKDNLGEIPPTLRNRAAGGGGKEMTALQRQIANQKARFGLK